MSVITGASVGSDGLKRDVGFFGLFFVSAGSVIGSGWLFAAFYALVIAGPASILSWLLGLSMVLFIVLAQAELSGMFPVSGGSSKFPLLAFGSFAGASFGWFTYLQAVVVAPLEAVAALQYASSASLLDGIYDGDSRSLTGKGIAIAAAALVVFTIINLFGIRWMARVNSPITMWKIIVPFLTIAVLLFHDPHWSNFTAGGGFFVTENGGSAHTILAALVGGGVIFAMSGFDSATQLGGESVNPEKHLPWAVIGSFALGAAVFLGVQIAFIVSLDPATIASYGSWSNLSADEMLGSSPFYTVAAMAGLGWLAWTLRVDAVLSPGATGLIYLTTTSRIAYGNSRSGYVPEFLQRRTRKALVPLWGILSTFIVGLVFLLPFPSWQKLASVCATAGVLMYSGIPLSLGALRHSLPDASRPFRMPFAEVTAPLGFVFASWIVYWSGWQVYSTLVFTMMIGFIVVSVTRRLHLNSKEFRIDWRAARWLVPYLGGIALCSYLGDFGQGPVFSGIGPFSDVLIGANGVLPEWIDLVAVSALALVTYFVAVRTRLPDEVVAAHVADLFVSESDSEVVA
jgi:amino acid transporter